MHLWRRQRRVFYGWRMLAAAIPMVMVLHGITKRSFGLLFDPLQKEFGWSATVIALVFSLDRVEGGVMAPLMGYLIDRLGGRKIMFLGSAVIGVGLILASQIHSLWQFYVAFLIINTGASAGSISTMQAVMVRWFERYRGRVLGIMETAPSLGSILVPIMAATITAFGWRWTLGLSGVGLLSVCLPLSLLIRSRPQDYGLLPDGAVAIDDASRGPGSTPDHRGAIPSRGAEGISIRQALRLPTFWLIATSVAVFGIGHNAERLLIIPHLQAKGFSREAASFTASAGLLLFGPPARLTLGWMSDKVNVMQLYPTMFLLQGLSLLLLAHASQNWHVFLFALLYESAFAANLIFQNVLIAQFFGTHRFASIRGLIHSVGIVVSVLSPVLGGLMFDIHGSYTLFFSLLGAVALLGIPPILLAKEVSWQEQTQEPTPRPGATPNP